MKIVIGTKNQKKVEVVTAVFQSVLAISDIEVIRHNASSKVPEAPHGEETFQGALNRATDCQHSGKADFYVGIESGIVERYGNVFEEAWAVIISHNGIQYAGYSSGLLLPHYVQSKMNEGLLHNEIMSAHDKKYNLPEDNRDTWSRYTGGTLSRAISIEESVRNALIQTIESGDSMYAIRKD